MTGQNTFQVFSISLVLTLAGIEAARAEESPRPALELRKGGNTIPEYGLRRTKAPPEKAQSKVEIERIPRNSFSTEVVRRETWTNAVGEVVVEESSYFHLFPGANLKDAATGEWKPAQVNIREESNGVVAEGWFTARFGDSLADESFAVLAATGQRLSGHITGLRYEDLATGKTVMLATTKRSLPAKDADGRIVYADAFEGLVKGEIVYIVKSGQVEQDIVILNRLPDPASLGLDPAGTFVQAVTRFAEAPAPTVQQRQISVSAGAGEIPFQDHHLWFGPVHMAMGRAFAKAAEAAPSARTPVYKRWESSPEGATLIESVPYSAYQQLEEAAGLPQQLDPAEGKSLAGSPAVVLDWIAVQSQPTYTFETGQTYRITGYISISTSATFEPWCILKYDRNAQLQLQGAVTFPTSGQAILTAVDDHTIGEQVGTDPAPTGTYAQIALYIYPSQLSGTIKNTQIRYAYEGIQAYCAYLYLEDISYINCTRALAAYATTVYETDGIRCDTPTEFHNYGSAYWVPSGNYVHVVGTNDRDSDLLSNFEELVWWFSDPRNAYTWSATHKDGEFHLTAVTGEGGTRVSVSANPVYDSGSDTTFINFVVANPLPGELHGLYVYNAGGQFWKHLAAGPPDIDPITGEAQYSAVTAGNQVGASFAALARYDDDFDGLDDGYEVKMTQTLVGNPDSSGNDIADGDEDSDSDGLTTSQEWDLGTDPLVAESSTDSDGDGLPDWFEIVIGVSAGPWDDPDGDGVPNTVEFEIGSNPALADYGGYFPSPAVVYPSDPTAHAAEFVSIQYNDVPYSAGEGPSGNANFPTAGFSLGPLGATVGMTVIPSNFGGSGLAEVRFEIMPVQDFYNNVWPFTDDGSPTQFEVQKPDPADGTNYRALLEKATKFAGGAAGFIETVWGQIDESALQALRQRSLEYVSATTKMKISYNCRALQWLEYHRLNVGDQPGLRLQIQKRVSVIHTEMTKSTAIHLRYLDAYPNDGPRYLGKVLKSVQWFSFAVNLPNELQTFKERILDYVHDVQNQQDTEGPGLLSLKIQEFLSSIPGMPGGLISTTTPILDPCPLGFYEGGGGEWADCFWHY